MHPPGMPNMKTQLALLGMVSLAFASCDKKEPVTHTPPVQKKRSSGSHSFSTNHTATKPKSAAASEMAQTPARESNSTTWQSRPGPAIASKPASAPVDPQRAAMVEATEKLRQERLARMAEAREVRVAQMTTQIAERYKQQDVNGDGLLSKDEVNGRTQQRFAENDKNGDGYLDASEQDAMIQATSQRMGDAGGGRRGGGNNGGGGSTRRGRGTP